LTTAAIVAVSPGVNMPPASEDAKKSVHGVLATDASRRFVLRNSPSAPSAGIGVALRNFLILRKPLSGCLEKRTALIQPGIA
jgi:hypothetical protein